MAGSGHLQTLKLLKFLRGRNFTDGHSNYGTQMAVSFALVAPTIHVTPMTKNIIKCDAVRCDSGYRFFST